MHGVTHTLDEIQARGVPGFDVEIVAHRPQRRPAACRRSARSTSFYAGLKVGVRPPGDRRDAGDGPLRPRARLVPGPGGVARRALARHGAAGPRQLPHRARRLRGLRSGDPLGMAPAGARAFYGGCRHV
jgi:hypothetical protein